MRKQKVMIVNATGLQLEAADLICKTAVQFRCKITFERESAVTNAKSVLGILGASIKNGDEVEIVCDGEDEEQALNSIVKLVERGLEE